LRIARKVTLLHHVRQFVGDQASPRAGARRVLPRPEDHIAPHRVRQRVHGSRRLSRPGIGMHAHPAEIVAEARLHEGPRLRIERLARRAQHFVDNRRHGGRPGALGDLALEALRPARRALAVEAGCATAGTCALEQRAMGPG